MSEPLISERLGFAAVLAVLGGVVPELDDGLGEVLGYALDEAALEELGGVLLVVSSLDDEPLELEPRDDVPDAPMPPVVDELPLAPELPIVLSLDAERVLPPVPSSVVAHAPSTSDAAVSVEIASVLIRIWSFSLEVMASCRGIPDR